MGVDGDEVAASGTIFSAVHLRLRAAYGRPLTRLRAHGQFRIQFETVRVPFQKTRVQCNHNVVEEIIPRDWGANV